MRIQHISLKRLFGVFDYAIPLNLENRITIIHGLNGFGKTAILRLTYEVFANRFQALLTYPFESITFIFDDQGSLTVAKYPQQQDDQYENQTSKFTFTYQQGTKTMPIYEVDTKMKRDFDINDIEGNPDFARLSPDRWLFHPTEEVIRTSELPQRFPELHLIGKERTTLPWLKTLRQQMKINLIETQRLLIQKQLQRIKISPQRREYEFMVDQYARELADKIRTISAAAEIRSQQLDRTYATRLITGQKKEILKEIELLQRLSELEEKRARFIRMGLMEDSRFSSLPMTNTIDESTRAALSVYAQDTAEKLLPYEALYAKIETFTSIINKRFRFKQLVIKKDKGMAFLTDDGHELPPSSLSSGEQHELVLFYELLFDIDPETLVLIDEPELSLHVVWEHEFLKDIQDIIGIAHLDVLIATHSPQIISDRWDLTVELKGPERATISQ